MADESWSLGKSQMAVSLFVAWGDRKTRQRLPPSQPTEAKTWHCQDDRERKEEDEVWPSLRVPQRNHLHLLIWGKSDSQQISQFPFVLHYMWMWVCIRDMACVFFFLENRISSHLHSVFVQHFTANSSNSLNTQNWLCLAVWDPEAFFFPPFLKYI